MSKNILEMNHIGKSFYGNQVLKDVTIHVKPGEIVALIGENGAGKSTLMNILFGMASIQETGGFSGEILLDGKKISVKDPIDAMKYGIGMVHQEFMLIDGFCVAENIKLNRENLKWTPASWIFGKSMDLVDVKTMKKEAAATLNTFDIGIGVNDRTGSLPVGYKQFIEIARELDKTNIKLIVLDEPTAVLTETEAEKFIDVVKKVAEKGISFIFISHKLDEIKKISDRIFILRDGEIVGESATNDIDTIEMSRLMIGREVSIKRTEKDSKKNDKKDYINVSNLSVHMPGEFTRDVSFSIKRGEIFGIGGLAGHGKISISNGLMGMYPSTGKVSIDGKEINVNNTMSLINEGAAFVTEDRRGVGLMLDESIELNIVIAALKIQNRFLKSICGIKFYDKETAGKHADMMIEKLGIKCVNRHQPVRDLSGGNQQKVCIARALTLNPTLLLVSEPTRGIDIGAKKTILDTLNELNSKDDITIIITSSELAELRSICDRIAIVTEGEIAGILSPFDDDSKYGLLMSGVSQGLE